MRTRGIDFGGWFPGTISFRAMALPVKTNQDLAGELVVVDSVGSATLDAAAGAALYERAVKHGSGTEISL